MASAKARMTSIPPVPRRARKDRDSVATAGAKAEAVMAFVAQAPTAVAMTDKALRFIKASPLWLADFAMTEAEMMGRSSYELAPETRRKYGALHRRCLAGALVSSKPERIVVPNGAERWMMWDAAPWRDDDGKVGGLLITSRDVTAEKENEDELRRTRSFLTNILDNVPAPLIVKDTDGRVLIMNRAMEELHCISRADHIGRPLAHVIGPEMMKEVRKEDRVVLASGKPLVVESAQARTRDRGVRDLRKTKVAFRDEDGAAYILSISEDITERRKIQLELENTRAFLTTLIENVPIPLAVKDGAEGRIVLMNRANEGLLGISREEIMHKSAHELFTAEEADRLSREDRAAIRSGTLQIAEDVTIATPGNGVRSVRQMKIAVRAPNGSPYLLTISEDITDRKRTQDALKQALARAEAANVAKSEFLANMSHEIRTPLNGVLGLADALSHMQLDAQQTEIIRMILDSGKALTGILSDVLDLAKAEAGQLQLRIESFALRDTIGQAVFLFETVARAKGVDFKVEFDPKAPERLMGDPLRLRQIVSNLVSNAVKFTTEGQVAVRVGAAVDTAGAATVSVAVKDTGPGFSDQVRDKLFSRFEQGDGSVTRRFGGTGLGLSIANALAQMMGGEISCSAVPGEGATFVFRTRLEIDQAAPDAAFPENTEHDAESDMANDAARLGRRLRVLLAEDHLVNQRVVELMLGDMADLTIVGDGHAAVGAFGRHGPFDLVLMDTQMPLMDGLTATRRIREAEGRLGRSRTPIVSLTANAMAHQVQACLDAGADDHLAKPITSESLFATIHRALAAAQAPGEAEDADAQVA